MRWLKITLIATAFGTTACGAKESPAREEAQQAPPVSTQAETNEDDFEKIITKEALEKVAHLMEITANGRLTPLVWEAERSENFQSNFGNQPHSRYWFLLRRVGIDPSSTLRETLSEPYGSKRVGNETWFIWPDFAALPVEDLIPERLSFQDRARLREKIGEEGIAQIRAGEPYPGVRTAISETGRWVYFIHDIETDEEP